jgi:hypothetical protein
MTYSAAQNLSYQRHQKSFLIGSGLGQREECLVPAYPDAHLLLLPTPSEPDVWLDGQVVLKLFGRQQLQVH